MTHLLSSYKKRVAAKAYRQVAYVPTLPVNVANGST